MKMYKFFDQHIRILTGNENEISLISVSDDMDKNHRFYQKFLKDVAEYGIEIVEGPDIIEPSYVELRKQEYPTREEQFDMMYWDEINETTIWKDTIQSIKDKYPKTITGGTTIGPVPDWVIEEVNEYKNKQNQ